MICNVSQNTIIRSWTLDMQGTVIYNHVTLPIASKHLISFSTHGQFSLWIARYPGEICLERSTSEAAILKLSWQPGCVYVTSFHPLELKIGGKQKQPAIDLASFTMSASPFFSKQFSTTLSSVLSFWSLEHVWLKIIWLKSSHNPEW